MSELEYTKQGWRYATDATRHHRTRGWDYSGVGIYHITMVVAERYPLFGQLAGYHERILNQRGQLRAMIDYIHDNPRRRALKCANPDLFKIRQLYTIAGVPCTTLGNMFLAEQPMHAMIQCSRSLSQAEIDARIAECLTAAERGVIHVSAAISEGEKQCCRALREAGHQLIILLTEGFPKPDSPHSSTSTVRRSKTRFMPRQAYVTLSTTPNATASSHSTPSRRR